MVPVQGLPLEHHGGDDREDDERNDFLNHFKLHQVERAAVAFEAKPVGRYLATVFCESYHPREKDEAANGTIRPFAATSGGRTRPAS